MRTCLWKTLAGEKGKLPKECEELGCRGKFYAGQFKKVGMTQMLPLLDGKVLDCWIGLPAKGDGHVDRD